MKRSHDSERCVDECSQVKHSRIDEKKNKGHANQRKLVASAALHSDSDISQAVINHYKVPRNVGDVRKHSRPEESYFVHSHIRDSASFVVGTPNKYDKDFPFFRQPVEMGIFSQNNKRHFKHDKSQLKYYIPPENCNNVNFNLRIGYSHFIQRDEHVKEYLNDLLRWIQLNTQKFNITGQQAYSKCINTDFVCWRGLLTKLLCTPYENREGWKIAATLFEKTIYLCEFDTEQKIEYRARMTAREKEMTFWGYKFEQYVTSEKPDGKPDTAQPVNNHEAFCSVVRSRLKKHSLVFGGEVDCCEVGSEPVKYIELKTSREIETNRQMTNFKRFKLIKWWAQSFLIGIQNIIAGFRDDNGIVKRLENFRTMEIPKHCQDIPNPWSASACFNFLDEILHFIKSSVKKDDTRIVYMFSWEPGHNVECKELHPDSKYCFLPEWYTSPTSSNKDKECY